MNKKSILIKKIAIAAIFLGLGWILPLITGRIPEIGNMLCPMHIPILLCGFILGPWYGLIIGFVTPLTRGLIFGMPVFYPIGLSMAFELATYGLITGLLYELMIKKFKLKRVILIYIILIVAMIAGRTIWGITRLTCGLFDQNMFTWKMFLTGGFITAWPGIVIQLIIIPILLGVIYQTKLLEKLKYNQPNKNILEILNRITTLLNNQKQVVIAIDGMAASGKTTLANEIAKRVDANIIHTDDFYLPIDLRTNERLNQLCCNIDYERFQHEVINHLKENISYDKFDCEAMSKISEVNLKYKNVIIVEGAYAMHPILNKYYNYAIFLKTSKGAQKKRIKKRDGVQKLIQFEEKWIPLENQYFDKYMIEKKADLVINN